MSNNFETLDATYGGWVSPVPTPNFARLQIVESTVAGDYNNDGVVNAADYVVWRNNLGQTLPLANEDPNITPGMVTQEDYDVWAMNFGMTADGASLAAVVPEPASAMLLMMMLAMSFPPRRRLVA